MSTFLRDAKQCYSDFYDRGRWNDTFADEVLNGKDNIDMRKKCIQMAYKIIFKSSLSSEAIIDWVKTRHSVDESAKLKGITESSLRNQIYYFNANIGRELSFNNISIIEYLIMTDEISDKEWDKIVKQIQKIKIKSDKKLYHKVTMTTSKNLLINIPRKEYKSSVNDQKFNAFLRLIEPYFINERKRVQNKINNEYLDEAGYFNYLLSPGVKLSSKDKLWLGKIKKMLDDDSVKQYFTETEHRTTEIDEEVNKTLENKSIEKKNAALESDKYEIKTKRIQYKF